MVTKSLWWKGLYNSVGRLLERRKGEKGEKQRKREKDREIDEGDIAIAFFLLS